MELVASCWAELDNSPGCYVWDSAIPNHKRMWDGECDRGLATGPGTVRETWGYHGGAPGYYEETGVMRDGRRYGRRKGRGD